MGGNDCMRNGTGIEVAVSGHGEIVLLLTKLDCLPVGDSGRYLIDARAGLSRTVSQ